MSLHAAVFFAPVFSILLLILSNSKENLLHTFTGIKLKQHKCCYVNTFKMINYSMSKDLEHIWLNCSYEIRKKTRDEFKFG